MKRVALSGTNSEYTISSGKVGAIDFTHRLTHGTANTALTNDDVDQYKIHIRVSMWIKDEERDVIIDRMPLKVAAMATGFLNASFEYNQVSGTALDVLKAAAAGVYEIGSWGVRVFLGRVVQLGNGVDLKVEYFVDNEPLAADIDTDITDTYTEIREVVVENGVHDSLPTWKAFRIDTNDESWGEAIPDGAEVIMFINLDKTGILTASAPIVEAIVTGDGYKEKYSYPRLLSLRNDQFTSSTIANKRNQSFQFYKGAPLRNAKLDMTLLGSNINANKNYVVVMSSRTSPKMLAHAQAVQALDTQKELAHKGINDAHVNSLASQARKTLEQVRKS